MTDTKPLTSPNKLLVKPLPEDSQTVGALQKAKKTFKTFIGKSDKTQDLNKKSSKSQPKQEIKTLSYDSGPEDVSLLCSSQKSSKQRPSQSLAPQEVNSNFTLLTRHSMKSATLFHSGELCAVCENSMASNSSIIQSGFKCEECKLLFHTKCLHSSSQIPCRSPLSLSSTSNSLILSNINNNTNGKNFFSRVFYLIYCSLTVTQLKNSVQMISFLIITSMYVFKTFTYSSAQKV